MPVAQKTIFEQIYLLFQRARNKRNLLWVTIMKGESSIFYKQENNLGEKIS